MKIETEEKRNLAFRVIDLIKEMKINLFLKILDLIIRIKKDLKKSFFLKMKWEIPIHQKVKKALSLKVKKVLDLKVKKDLKKIIDFN